MKKRVLVLATAFVLIGTHVYAANGDLIVNGKLGVGTITPAQKLTIDLGFTRDGMNIVSDGDANAYSDLQFNVKTTGGLAANDPLIWELSHRKDGYFSGSTGPSLEFYGVKKGGGYYAPLAFKSNGDVIITSSKNATPANVGIGTTTPGEKLEVAGNLSISGSYLRFPHAYGDANDGKIGNSMFAQGLDIVGINNDNTARKIQLWGSITQNQNDLGNTWAGTNTFAGNINFQSSNPTLSAGSYMVIPGGAYFNSGTVYAEAAIQARGGLHNDAAAYLELRGGTTGKTHLNGNLIFPDGTEQATASNSAHAKLVFTSSGSWAVPVGVTTVYATLVGGGGGGGYGGQGGSGGGGGGSILGYPIGVSGGTVSVVVGQAGSGGVANGAGTSGTASQVSYGGLILTVGGGGGGGANGAAAGVGGSGGGIAYSSPGGSGHLGYASDGRIGHTGGGSAFGAGGTMGPNAPGGWGGGGGGGAYGNGGPGAPGIVILEY